MLLGSNQGRARCAATLNARTAGLAEAQTLVEAASEPYVSQRLAVESEPAEVPAVAGQESGSLVAPRCQKRPPASCSNDGQSAADSAPEATEASTTITS